jgi:hypothetical protein
VLQQQYAEEGYRRAVDESIFTLLSAVNLTTSATHTAVSAVSFTNHSGTTGMLVSFEVEVDVAGLSSSAAASAVAVLESELAGQVLFAYCGGNRQCRSTHATSLTSTPTVRTDASAADTEEEYGEKNDYAAGAGNPFLPIALSAAAIASCVCAGVLWRRRSASGVGTKSADARATQITLDCFDDRESMSDISENRDEGGSFGADGEAGADDDPARRSHASDLDSSRPSSKAVV